MEKNKCGNFHNTASSMSSTYILSFSPTLPQKHLDKYIVYIFNPQNRQIILILFQNPKSWTIG